MNPYECKKEDFLAWLKKRMEKYGYTPENAPDTYSKANKSGDPKDLPVLITQEWCDYLNPERWKNKNIEIKQGERVDFIQKIQLKMVDVIEDIFNN